VKYFAILALLCCGSVQAAGNLPLTCPTYPDCTNSQRVFGVPTADTMVSTEAGWQRFAEAETVLVCADDIPAGSHTGVCPPNRKVRVPRCEVHGAQCAPQEMGKNTVDLHWSRSTHYDDGSELDDLAGYKIYSGVAKADGSDPKASDLSLIHTTANPDATTITFPGYGWGKYFFAITAYNSKLKEGERSKVVFADFPEPIRAPGQVTGVTVEVTVVTGP
jgi:hypothetical protein